VISVRREIHLNFGWQFGIFESEHLKGVYENLTEVHIPHQVVDLPMNHFDQRLYEGMYTYTKDMMIDMKDQKKILRLKFEGVGHKTDLYINLKHVGTHLGGYTPFEFDIETYIKFGKINHIMVIVDTHENKEIPPFGGSMDYLAYGGIYREVLLQVLDLYHIQDVFVETDGTSDLKVHIKTSKNTGQLKVKIERKIEDTFVTQFNQNYDVVHSNTVLYVTLDNLMLWDLDAPNLYDISIEYKHESCEDHIQNLRFGIRHIEFKKDGFYLNHRRIKLIGLNRHQSYPYVGYAMPKSAQSEDADQLKFELGCNIVRSSHYPPSRHFLDRCDEIGLLAIEEIAGWQHIGDLAWQELSLKHLRSMVIRDRNHPCVIMWGTRINESPDHHDFYTKTNELARNLDPSRPTGGVRNIQFSEVLEDVYTYNDFSHTGTNEGLAKKKTITKDIPYLVTEFNGHMFPTKSYDNESHRIKHMKRHLDVIHSALYLNNKISGAIGWSMFDYHTHSAFGSGDNVCYHGVLDMFRTPKYASYTYLLNDPKASFMKVLSTMDIGEYPSGNLEDVYVLTSNTSVKLYKNDVYIDTFYKSHKTYPNLLHPPIVINDFIGHSLKDQEHMKTKDANKAKKVFKAITKYGNKLSLKHKLSMLYLMKKYRLTMDDAVKLFFKYTSGWGSTRPSYRFEGYTNDILTHSVTIEQNSNYDLILEKNDKPMIHAHTYDTKRFVIQKVNQHHMVLPYATDIIEIRCEGDIELIGPHQRQLFQGQTAFWIKSKQSGQGRLYIESHEFLLIEEVDIT